MEVRSMQQITLQKLFQVKIKASEWPPIVIAEKIYVNIKF